MNVTSRSASRSFLFPTITMTMLGLASVLASVSQLVRALYVSRLRQERKREKGGEGVRTAITMDGHVHACPHVHMYNMHSRHMTTTSHPELL